MHMIESVAHARSILSRCSILSESQEFYFRIVRACGRFVFLVRDESKSHACSDQVSVNDFKSDQMRLNEQSFVY